MKKRILTSAAAIPILGIGIDPIPIPILLVLVLYWSEEKVLGIGIVLKSGIG